MENIQMLLKQGAVGRPCAPVVAVGDKVKKGQRIMKFSREKIKAAGHPDTVVLLLTNSDDYENVKFGENV